MGRPGGVMGHAGVSAPGSARPPPRSVLWTPQPAWPRRVGRRGVCAVRLSGRSCADALAAWVTVLVSSPGPWAHACHGIARGRLPTTPERHASEFAGCCAVGPDAGRSGPGHSPAGRH